MTANRLSHAHSAYLRQHAENPVDWWEWSDEAFAEARRRDVPVFLSVGYAACHWCHVMAHESFEDERVADYLNQNFVAIKVDREERPDVDAIYMAATQSISGHGGWPMSVFLRPDGKAFMAGTYYPPEDRHGQPGFLRLLSAIQDGWTNQRHLIDQQTDEVSRAIEHEIAVVDRLAPATSNALEGVAQNLRTKLVASFHPAGGFSRAPKFPRPSYVNALLPFLDEPDVHHVVTVTLDQMSRRGLYDHIEGGFARYSVDDSWHVPHFEKMLSDQALLARVYLRADRAAGGQTPWRDVARDTLRFVVRDLALPHGYASSLDADSNGHEGAHATWTREQLVEALEGGGREARLCHDRLEALQLRIGGVGRGGGAGSDAACACQWALLLVCLSEVRATDGACEHTRGCGRRAVRREGRCMRTSTSKSRLPRLLLAAREQRARDSMLQLLCQTGGDNKLRGVVRV